MFRFLASRLIPDWEETSQPRVRTAYGQLASILSISANTLLFLIKLLTGMASGSLAIVADGINNLSDASSNIISLLGFRLASKPADEEHPYGHGRYEYLSGLMVTVLILAAGLELIKSSLSRIAHPSPPVFSGLTAAVLAGSIFVKLWMMAFNTKAGKLIGSSTLKATAADSRNDAITTGVVLAGMVLAHFLHRDLDGWLGLGVALFVLYSGLALVKKTLDPLLGQKPAPEEINAIKERILACPAVLGTHDLMVHDYGPGRRFASAHVEVDAEKDVSFLHDQLDALQEEFLQTEGLHIIFQIDPLPREDTEINRLRSEIINILKQVDNRMGIHDLHLIHDGKTIQIRFDCYAPADVNLTEKELRSMLEKTVHIYYPDADIFITIDRDFMAPPP